MNKVIYKNRETYLKFKREIKDFGDFVFGLEEQNSSHVYVDLDTKIKIGEYNVVTIRDSKIEFHNFAKDDVSGRNTAIVQNTIKVISKTYLKFTNHLYYSEKNVTYTDFKPYNRIVIKLLATIGVIIHDKNFVPKFESPEEYLGEKLSSSSRNSGNNPIFIDLEYNNAYVKFNGASGTESLFMLMANDYFFGEKLSIYRISENDNKSESRSLIEYIDMMGHQYNENILYDEKKSKFKFLNDGQENIEIGNLRNSQLYHRNVDENYLVNGIQKECAVCKTKEFKILEYAHIIEVQDIKRLENKTLIEKMDLVNSGKNGIYLCANHHKLFDSHKIIIKESGFENRSLSDDDWFNKKTLDDLIMNNLGKLVDEEFSNIMKLRYVYKGIKLKSYENE